MDFEKKLIEYRNKKRREHLINKNKESIQSFFGNLLKFRRNSKKNMKESTEINIDEKEQLEELLPSDDIDVSNKSEDFIDDDDNSRLFTCSKIDYIFYFLLFIFWATLYVIFIKLQFGTVFLVVSAIIGMYFNTRTGPRRPNEVSAYSVFNKNCESIDGTLKAEQFEREIRYGSGAVH